MNGEKIKDRGGLQYSWFPLDFQRGSKGQAMKMSTMLSKLLKMRKQKSQAKSCLCEGSTHQVHHASHPSSKIKLDMHVTEKRTCKASAAQAPSDTVK